MQKSKKSSALLIALLQGSVIIFSLSSVLGKIASKYVFLSFNYLIWICAEILFLGIYAIVWQQLIQKTDISIAYANKATSIFWSMIFAALLFKEVITIKNILGVIIVFIGIMVVNKND